jgi:transmembrane sensor
MTISSDADRERAETEAARWLVLLSEDPDDRDLRARFETWLAETALHAELWARTTRAYELAGKGVPQYREQWQRGAPRVGAVPIAAGATTVPWRSASPKWFRSPRRLAVGVAVAALAACLVLAAPSVLLRLQADYVTSTAELRSLSLEDGSRIHLGPESALDVAFANGERRVRLLNGEAFFEVAPDATRPFRVVASDVVATVLGTAFEVRLNADRTAVTVRHGHVRVSGGTPPISEDLYGGDWLHFSPAFGVKRGTRRDDEIGDWLQGQFVTHDRPVIEVVDKLRRYYNGMIVVQDKTFAETRVTGIYDLRDPVATLRSLASSHDATVHRVSPWLLVVTSK